MRFFVLTVVCFVYLLIEEIFDSWCMKDPCRLCRLGQGGAKATHTCTGVSKSLALAENYFVCKDVISVCCCTFLSFR